MPPYTCDTPGPDTFTQSTTDVMTAGGVACAAGGITTENAYCRVYTAADMGNDQFTIDCVRFGMDNPGSYIEGAFNLYKSANGTPAPLCGPPASRLRTVGLLPHRRQRVQRRILRGRRERRSLGWFGADHRDRLQRFARRFRRPSVAARRSDISNGTTYLRSASCGIVEFTPVGDIGFDLEWFVFTDGTAGGGQPDCPGDFNGDGMVDGADFGFILAAWGTCGGCPEDLNGDGEVNGADVGLVLSVWGACP